MKRLNREEVKWLLANKSPSERKDWVQEDVFRTWETVRRGTFEGATGVGKSRVAVMAMQKQFEKNPDSVVYLAVPTETLRDDDWPKEMTKWGAKHLIDKVHRICWKSLGEEVSEREVDLFIGDEFHHLTILNSAFFSTNKVYDMLCLTATLPTLDGIDTNDRDKRIMIDNLAPSFYKITLEEAVELELVADFDVVVLKFNLDNMDQYIPFGKGFTTEASHYLYLSKELGKCMYRRPGAKFIWIQRRTELLKNLRSKERLVKEVMEKVHTPGKRTLLFFGSIAASERICGENVYNSRTDSAKLKAFQKGDIDYLGAVQALNEGKNIADLDQTLMVSLTSKERNALQQIGRIIRFRPGHKGLVIVFVAKKTADEKWYETAFKNFDKSRIKEYDLKPKEVTSGTT